MANARKRHYRVAQKAAEAEVCQREDENRHSLVVTYLTIVVLAAQIINLAISIYRLFPCNKSDYE